MLQDYVLAAVFMNSFFPSLFSHACFFSSFFFLKIFSQVGGRRLWHQEASDLVSNTLSTNIFILYNLYIKSFLLFCTLLILLSFAFFPFLFFFSLLAASWRTTRWALTFWRSRSPRLRTTSSPLTLLPSTRSKRSFLGCSSIVVVVFGLLLFY